jgi:uncharacterized RDD family membrane protein YckC
MTGMTPIDWQLPDPERHAAFYADVPAKRLLAWLVDSVLVLGLTLVAVLFTAFIGLFFLPFLWLALSFAYRSVTIARDSATWGMRFAGIELRNFRGERLSAVEAVMHTGLHLACMSFLLPQLASIVAMLITPRGQGLPDLALATTALNRRR